VTIANLELVREDARPLLDRLEATSRTIVCGMVKAWLEAEGFPADALPEEASGRTSQVSWQEAGPRSAAKKPRVYH